MTSLEDIINWWLKLPKGKKALYVKLALEHEYYEFLSIIKNKKLKSLS